MLRAHRRWLAVALTGASLAGVSLVVPAPAVASVPARPTYASVPARPTYLWSLIGKTTNDPVVNYYYRSCSLRQDIHCLAQGFELDLTATTSPPFQVVYQVVLYSNRNTGFAQYGGKLPWGITWATNAHDLIGKIGKPSQVAGGFGTDITFVYYAPDGYKVEIELVARHMSDLTPNTLMHDIKLSRWK
jgi:hypothetical protein